MQVINSDALVVYAAGLKEIPLADPQPAAATVVIVLIVFLFIMLLPYHLPIVLRTIAPIAHESILGGMTEWLLARTRLIEIIVGLGLGGIFLYKGLGACSDPTQVAASSAAYLARRASSSSFLGKSVKTIAAPRRTATMPAMYAH